MNMGMTYAKLAIFQKSRSSICSCNTQEQALCYNNNAIAWKTGGMSHLQEIIFELEMTGGIFLNDKRLSQIESTLTGIANLLLFFCCFSVLGRKKAVWRSRVRAQMYPDHPQNSSIYHYFYIYYLVHVYQHTSYWNHNYIIRYNCICYGLVWQPNEAVIKELVVPLIRG